MFIVLNVILPNQQHYKTILLNIGAITFICKNADKKTEIHTNNEMFICLSESDEQNLYKAIGKRL